MKNEAKSSERSIRHRTDPPWRTSSHGEAPGNGRLDHPIGTGEKNRKPERHRPKESLTKAKVLIVHSMPLIRFGLIQLIGARPQFAVCAETDDAPAAREFFVRYRPEIVVLGLTLHGGDGIELIKDFRRQNTAVGILVLSTREDVLSVERAFRAGAHGYLLAHEDVPQIMTALDEISAGNFYASARVARRLLKHCAQNGIQPETCELKTLSDRELQVFSLIGRGFGASRLAHELHLSVKTIETYQMHLKEKLGLHSAAELSEKASEWMARSARYNLQLRQRMLHENGRYLLPSLYSC